MLLSAAAEHDSRDMEKVWRRQKGVERDGEHREGVESVEKLYSSFVIDIPDEWSGGLLCMR
jgi:hypothetical protein